MGLYHLKQHSSRRAVPLRYWPAWWLAQQVLVTDGVERDEAACALARCICRKVRAECSACRPDGRRLALAMIVLASLEGTDLGLRPAGLVAARLLAEASLQAVGRPIPMAVVWRAS